MGRSCVFLLPALLVLAAMLGLVAGGSRAATGACSNLVVLRMLYIEAVTDKILFPSCRKKLPS